MLYLKNKHDQCAVLLRIPLCIGVALSFLLSGCGTTFFRDAEQTPQGLIYPRVAFNFDPNVPVGEGENTYWDRSVYLYDIATKDVEVFCDDDIFINDCDLQRMLALGVTETDVVEVNLENGEHRKLGPLQYAGEEVDIYSVQWRPNSEDYSAVTADGQLLLWRHDTQAFEVLAQIGSGREPFEGMFYDYVWIHQGQDVCIPDAKGLAILNVETGEAEHWLDLNITYPNRNWGAPQKSYDVSGAADKVLYTFDREIRMVQIGADGDHEETILFHGDPIGNKGFSFSPDGKEVVFAVEQTATSLTYPEPRYYETWLWHEGEVTKLFETGKTNKDIRVYG